jgi:AcrR family transcriptional regulator
MLREPGLRERKKERTRQALVDAAIALFDAKGYDETTVAELAAAADVSPRTFFSHFSSKEEVLFADSAGKVEMSADALTEPLPGEGPAQLLMRSVRTVLSTDPNLTGPLARVRTKLIFSTPSLQAYALRKVLEGQQELADGLLKAFPELDKATTAAMTGAVVGAMTASIATLYSDPQFAASAAARPEWMRDELDRALNKACRYLGEAAS